MPKVPVQFRYLTGLIGNLFSNARLAGSWDDQGKVSTAWSEIPMTPGTAEDGCPCFTATVELDDGEVEQAVPAGASGWTDRRAPTCGASRRKSLDMNSTDRYREFVLAAGGPQQEDFYFTYARRLGARKHFSNGSAPPGLRFSVWAPNAQAVDVVVGRRDNGYIADDGDGIDPARPVLPLTPGPDGIWQSEVLPSFAAFHGAPLHDPPQERPGAYGLSHRSLLAASKSAEAARIRRARALRRKPFHARRRQGLQPRPGTGDHRQGVRRPRHGSRPRSRVPGRTSSTPGLPLYSRIPEDLIIYELHVNALQRRQGPPRRLARRSGPASASNRPWSQCRRIAPHGGVLRRLRLEGYGDSHCLRSNRVQAPGVSTNTSSASAIGAASQ